MQPGQLRRVPLWMQQDGWWLDAPARGDSTGQGDPAVQRPRGGIKAAVLLALIACGDLLVWQRIPALSLAVLVLLVLGAGMASAWRRLRPSARLGIACGAVICVLPLVEQVQPLSLLVALCGISVCCAALAGLARGDLLRGARRLWWVAPVQTAQDAVAVVTALGAVRKGGIAMRALMLGWALPVGATALFAVLLVGANPVLDRALSRLADWQMPSVDLARLWVWALLGAVIWPVLGARALHERLRARPVRAATVEVQGLVNAGSVARSLVAFNALFAVQTGMDVLFLYGDAGLPEGISPAAYAHRGAYPLLVTALLAGVFAVLARPHLAGRPGLRWLMLAWLGQTLALVAASVWRLEAYVDIYGLTRLRLAAYVWMGLVAAGLGIVVWQIWRDKPAAWMMRRSGALGVVVLYLCAFVSFDATIARHNLARHAEPDIHLLCALSEDVAPAMAERFGPGWAAQCGAALHVPRVFHPADWREWGFRNWRVRRSLAAMTPETFLP